MTFGRWEGVCGKKKTKEALFILLERLTRQEIIMKIPDQTSASIVVALNKLERRYGKCFSRIFKSITFDNGSEFADCAGIERAVYGKGRKLPKAYYCHPYNAYERGTKEYKQNDTAALAEGNRLPESNRRIYSPHRNVDQ